MRFLTVYSFCKQNPGWKVKLYYPHQFYRGDSTWTAAPHKKKFTGTDYMSELRKLPVEWIEFDFSSLGVSHAIPEPYKADYLRWHLLATEGGVWSDMDILYIKPIGALYLNSADNSAVDTVVCLNTEAKTCSPYYSIGFLLSSAENAFYRFISDHAQDNFDSDKYQSVGRLLIKRYFPDLRHIVQRFPDLNLWNLSMNVVYSYDHTRVDSLFKPAWQHLLNSQSIGVHWYAGNSTANRFENLLTAGNYQQYDCLFTRLIASLLEEGAF